MAEDHTFTLNGDERWLVRFTTLEGGAYGYTYSQKSKRPRILIHDGLRGRHRLTIIIHELLQTDFEYLMKRLLFRFLRLCVFLCYHYSIRNNQSRQYLVYMR